MSVSAAIRVIGVLLVVAAMGLAFVATSLAALEITGSRTIGWIAGTLACPVGPLVWCVASEVRRRTPGALTRLDRCVLRIVALDGVIVAALFGLTDVRSDLTIDRVRRLWADDAPIPASRSSVDIDVRTTSKRAKVEPGPTANEPPAPQPETIPDRPATPPTPRAPPPVASACADGRYTEPLPDAHADISDLVDAYDPERIDAFVEGALQRRYPVGAKLVEGGQKLTDCVNAFTVGQTDTADALVAALPTVTHECGHLYDLAKSKAPHRSHLFAVADGHELVCAGGMLAKTFARAELSADEFAARRPACSDGAAQNCDGYAEIYLTGTSGDQGFDMLVEELVQYIHALATALAFADLRDGNTSMSHRDGVLTFLWYVQRYLHAARTAHPRVHAKLLGDACWRRLVLEAWGRAWLYLDATADERGLGIDDDEIEALVRDPDLLAEIEAVREADGCAVTPAVAQSPAPPRPR